MSKSNVIQDIKSKIRPNGEQNITGQVLQDVLVESVNLVPEKVSELVNDSQYQTKANLDTALASKADASSIPTKVSQLANDTGFVTSTEVSTTYATKAEVPTKTSQLTNDSQYQTKANLDTALATKADKSSLASKQDKLVSGTNIKTINSQSLLGSGNISIESTSITVDSALSTTSENPVQNKVVTKALQTKANASDIPTKVSQLENDSKFATQTAVVQGLATKADKDSLTSLEGSVSTLETTVGNQDKAIVANAQAIQGKQDKLVSGTNIKTINNQSLLGEGNISIESGTSITVDSALSDTSENPVQNKVITTKVNSLESSLESKANASDIPTKVSQLENDSQYQTKANVDTALADYAKTSDVNSKNTLQDTAIQNNADAIATINQTLATKADTSAIPTKVSQLENDSGFATTTNVSATYATKESVTALTAEVNNKANASDIPTKVSQLENDSTYQTKANLDTALESYAKTSDVNSKNASQDEAIQGKQDKLVSGTNIKTINNQSLLGEGNISIESGTSITVDSALSDTSENPVQNKVITTKVNSLESSLESKANASDIPTKVSQLENDSQYQTKANVDTALADYAKTSDVNSKNTLQDTAIQNNADAIATINQTLATKADTSAIPTKVSQLENDSGFATTTNVSATYATKESVTALTAEVNNKANASDIPTKVSQLENDSTYQTKANLDTALESYAKTSDVNSKNASQDEAIQGKQDKLVSGTNIKTINNQSLLGSGNISIESGTSITVDSALSDTSENPVQNKVITTKVNSLETSLGSKASQTDLDNLSSTVTTQGQTITSIQTEIGDINTQLTEING